MTHNEVLKKWIGKQTLETIELWFQCVAWVKKYCSERWYPIKSFGGSAYNGWKTWRPFDSSWKWIIYDWFNAPSEGDVIFWNEGRCKDWHVAIANKFCYPFLFRYIDQNWGWKEEFIQPRWTGWKNVVGWYTRKK